jgi:hypothetical protein
MPHDVDMSLVTLAIGMVQFHSNCGRNLSKRVANLIHTFRVVALMRRVGERNDHIDIFGHSVKSEVDLAEKGSSFEQQLISKMLRERPDESGQIEILLDCWWRNALLLRCLFAKISEDFQRRQRRQGHCHGRTSFSTTFHLVLRVPRRGREGIIDKLDELDYVAM